MDLEILKVEYEPEGVMYTVRYLTDGCEHTVHIPILLEKQGLSFVFIKNSKQRHHDSETNWLVCLLLIGLYALFGTGTDRGQIQFHEHYLHYCRWSQQYQLRLICMPGSWSRMGPIFVLRGLSYRDLGLGSQVDNLAVSSQIVQQ